MAEKKRHHYVPRSYLKGFADNDKVHVLFTKSHSIKNTNINNVCVESRFYKVNEKYKTVYQEWNFEDVFFSKTVEPIFSDTIGIIDSTVNELSISKDKYALINMNDITRKIISYLILIQYYRTPRFRKLFDNKKTTFINSIINKKGETLSVLDDPVLLHAFHSFTNPQLMRTNAEKLKNDHWIFRYSPNGDFYTSDNPVIVYDNKLSLQNKAYIPALMGNPHSIVFFPINRHILLEVFSSNEFPEKQQYNNSIYLVGSDYVNQINSFTFLNAEKCVISYRNDFNTLYPLLEIKII